MFCLEEIASQAEDAQPITVGGLARMVSTANAKGDLSTVADGSRQSRWHGCLGKRFCVSWGWIEFQTKDRTIEEARRAGIAQWIHLSDAGWTWQMAGQLPHVVLYLVRKIEKGGRCAIDTVDRVIEVHFFACYCCMGWFYMQVNNGHWRRKI